MKLNGNFTVIYSFKVIDGKEDDFINAWTELTKLIYKFAGSYGSRLHKADKQLFIGYAQWEDKETWQHSGNKLTDTAKELRKQMRESCTEIKTEYELTVVQELLNDRRYNEIKK